MSSTDRPVVRRDFTEKTPATRYPFISPLAQNLSGRHVLITGAAWEDGVGYATATAFARAGASAIAVIDLHGVSDELVSRLTAAAVEAGRAKPQVVSGRVDISRWRIIQSFFKRNRNKKTMNIQYLKYSYCCLNKNDRNADHDGDLKKHVFMM